MSLSTSCHAGYLSDLETNSGCACIGGKAAAGSAASTLSLNDLACFLASALSLFALMRSSCSCVREGLMLPDACGATAQGSCIAEGGAGTGLCSGTCVDFSISCAVVKQGFWAFASGSSVCAMSFASTNSTTCSHTCLAFLTPAVDRMPASCNKFWYACQSRFVALSLSCEAHLKFA